MRPGHYLLAAALAASGTGPAAAGATLDAVEARGFLLCGVTQGLPGFSSPDDEGEWSGFDVDFCRAIAAAVFGDAGAVRFTPLSSKERFTALQSGEVDVLSRVTTWTLTRDTALGLDFVGVSYYDGQGFMVPAELEVESALELDGVSVCTNAGTTTELNMSDFFRSNGMTYELVVFEKSEEVVAAYEAGRCDVFTSDQSGLYSKRGTLSEPSAHVVLPEVISKEPLGPAVRHGDNEWGDVVRWTLFAILAAEELGVTSDDVGELASTAVDPNVRRLLGAEGKMGENLGLEPDWALNVIAQVGNYGEVFDRNLADELGVARGLNALWSAGGLHYPMPIR